MKSGVTKELQMKLHPEIEFALVFWLGWACCLVGFLVVILTQRYFQ